MQYKNVSNENKLSQLDSQSIRAQFPMLHTQVNGYPLIYFDNAATTQKPQTVIDALVHYYQKDNANVHRGMHTLAHRATEALEATRMAVQKFIHAATSSEIIFTKGTTEAINLVASTYGRSQLRTGDEMIISTMEHHANIVPWQMLCKEKGALLKAIPLHDSGELAIATFDALLTERTKIVAITHASNTLGTVNPIQQIIQKAHAYGAVVLVDGAQTAPHLPIDVQALDCDFFVFSAHKVYGPTGVGILYGKKELLEKMPPYQGGGAMIQNVTMAKTTYNDLPYKFEAGTYHIAGIVAFKAALDFIEGLGKANIAAHEAALTTYALKKLCALKNSQIIGHAQNTISVISFLLLGRHHFDVGLLLNAKGIAVRTGHHCTQPLMQHFKIDGTIRISFAVYNTLEEIDQFIAVLSDIIKKQQ